jgi:XRE family transcriptional regulator, aerobic/anaerobic benzoate catabolism transcriptional regulator
VRDIFGVRSIVHEVDMVAEASEEARLTRAVRDREARRIVVLKALADSVRAERVASGLTLRALASLAGVSERFLVQLESGEGNISVARLYDLADALGTSPAELLVSSGRESHPRRRGAPPSVVALLGVRGAGKSAVGQLVAKKLKAPLVELDALVAKEAGMSVPTLFEIHGEAYFRRIERQVLRRLLDAAEPVVIATGGSIVTDSETFALLRKRALTIWLKADAVDHWRRVTGQGDLRPMRGRKNAMNELRALMRKRTPLYAQADHVVDTTSESVEEVARRVARLAEGLEPTAD